MQSVRSFSRSIVVARSVCSFCQEWHNPSVRLLKCLPVYVYVSVCLSVRILMPLVPLFSLYPFGQSSLTLTFSFAYHSNPLKKSSDESQMIIETPSPPSPVPLPSVSRPLPSPSYCFCSFWSSLICAFSARSPATPNSYSSLPLLSPPLLLILILSLSILLLLLLLPLFCLPTPPHPISIQSLYLLPPLSLSFHYHPPAFRLCLSPSVLLLVFRIV